MSALGDDFRARAQASKEAAATIMQQPTFGTDQTKVVVAIVASQNVHLFWGLAKIADLIQDASQLSPVQRKLAAIAKDNSSIRMSAGRGAALGDWDEFDNFVNDITDGSDPTANDGAAAVK